jgi:hypothetical protein
MTPRMLLEATVGRAGSLKRLWRVLIVSGFGAVNRSGFAGGPNS